MIRKVIILILDRLLDREIRLGDIIAMDREGNIFLSRQKKSGNENVTLKKHADINQKISIDEVLEKGGQIVYNLAEKIAREKGCTYERLYDKLPPNWAWAAKLKFPDFIN